MFIYQRLKLHVQAQNKDELKDPKYNTNIDTYLLQPVHFAKVDNKEKMDIIVYSSNIKALKLYVAWSYLFS